MHPKIKEAYDKLAKSVIRRGHKKLVLTRGDVALARLSLPWDDETFGSVVALGPLGFTQNIGQALGEVHRVLKPGGKAAVAVWTRQAGRYYERPQFYFAEKEFIDAVDNLFDKTEHSIIGRNKRNILRAAVVTKAK